MARTCSECGKEFRSRQYNGAFCGGSCRRVFNNRRVLNGLVVYDLVMIAATASSEKDRAEAERRLDAFVAKHITENAGRRTHKPAYEVFRDTGYLAAEVIVARKAAIS